MTYLIWMIKNPKDAIIAALAFIGAALYALFKLKSAKVEKLSNEVQETTKALDIEKKQSVAVAEILTNEQEEVIKLAGEQSEKSHSERIDNL